MTAGRGEIVPHDESARCESIPDQFGIEVDVLLVMGRIDEDQPQALDRRGKVPTGRVGEMLDDVPDAAFTVEGADLLLGDQVCDHLAAG